MALRCILILLDGLGDRAYDGLGNQTPLQAARTPNLDKLAAMGANGLFHADRIGVALPSENAHFAMFGFQKEEFPGRGILEALGADIPVTSGDVALLAHFASVKEENSILKLIKQRPKVTKNEAENLAQRIASHSIGKVKAKFVQTHQLDGILVLSGGVCPSITDTDPIAEGENLIEVAPYKDFANDKKAKTTAKALKSYLLWCYEALRKDPFNRKRIKKGQIPVNFLLTQRAGQLKKIETFSERWGMRGLSISSGLVYWGLGKFLGMDIAKVKDSKACGDDLAERIQLAVGKKQNYEFIHVHTKAPDAAGHSKDPQNKVATIEALDQGLKAVLKHIDDETLFMITADHSTPSAGPLVHSGEPVPLMLVGPGIRKDTVKKFDEIHCACGALGCLQGKDLMPLVLNCLDRAKLQGLRDTPEDRQYWPAKRTPFRIK